MSISQDLARPYVEGSEPTLRAHAAVVIEPPRRWQAFDARELWRYRDLLYILAWRDVKVRYKQTAVGIGWAILQPLLTMVAFSIIFGRLIGVPSDGVPYPLFAYTALVPWTFVANAVNRSSTSIVSNPNLISKVYVPRVVVPTSAVLAIVIDLAAGLLLLLPLLMFYGITPGAALLSLPLFVLLAVVTAVGVGLWLSALNVVYRDVTHVVPFLTQFWLFVTPVAYASAIVPDTWRVAYGLNPLTTVVDGFRWSVLGTPAPSVQLVTASTLAALGVLVSGLLYFHHLEDRFADLV